MKFQDIMAVVVPGDCDERPGFSEVIIDPEIQGDEIKFSIRISRQAYLDLQKEYDERVNAVTARFEARNTITKICGVPVMNQRRERNV